MDGPKPKKYERLSKEVIIAAIQEVARRLGRAPKSREFTPLSGISTWQLTGRFDTYCNAVRAAGLKPNQQGVKVEAAALLEDWGKVVRRVGAVPSRRLYTEAGSYSIECFSARFERWTQVPAEFTRFVAAGGLAGDWTDVLEKIREGPIPTQGWSTVQALNKAARAAYEGRVKELLAGTECLTLRQENMGRPIVGREAFQSIGGLETLQHEAIAASGTPLPPPLVGKKCVTATMLAVFVAELAPSGFPWVTAACFPRRALKDRPLLGAPTRPCGLAYEPVNEMGVLALFCMLSRQLGFVIESVQAGFPDCEAKIEVAPGRWQHFRIEFEYESRNFKDHRHDPEKCDLIVCWRHNWKDCPANLQVLELSKVMRQRELW
jgi:Homing endonuclease associated repeat